MSAVSPVARSVATSFSASMRPERKPVDPFESTAEDAHGPAKGAESATEVPSHGVAMIKVAK